MTSRIVKTQAELDQAIADKVDLIEIHSPQGVWLTINDLGSSRAVLRESSRAELWGSSRAVLRESSRAVLRESSRAELWGSSRAELWGSSRAELWGSSRAVLRESSRAELWGSSRAELWESSSAVLRESSSAVLRGSSSAVLWGSSRAELRESSSAVLRESSSAHVYAKSKVKASPLCAVFLHESTVDVSGGVVIDHSGIGDMDGPAWCEYHGVKVSRGIATVYKAVNDQWTTSRGIDYSPGSKPSCDDFRADNTCGGGLHFGPTPSHAKAYFNSATKFVAVGVKVSELQPIHKDGDVAKCKVPRVVRAAVEVDIDGNVIERSSKVTA